MCHILLLEEIRLTSWYHKNPHHFQDFICLNLGICWSISHRIWNPWTFVAQLRCMRSWWGSRWNWSGVFFASRRIRLIMNLMNDIIISPSFSKRFLQSEGWKWSEAFLIPLKVWKMMMISYFLEKCCIFCEKQQRSLQMSTLMGLEQSSLHRPSWNKGNKN